MPNLPFPYPTASSGATDHRPREQKHEVTVVTYRDVRFAVTRKLTKAEKKALKRRRRPPVADLAAEFAWDALEEAPLLAALYGSGNDP